MARRTWLGSSDPEVQARFDSSLGEVAHREGVLKLAASDIGPAMALGLTGAVLVFAEFVLNFEVLGHLTSDNDATFSDLGTQRVITIYRTLSFLHMGAVTTAITLLLLS